MKDKTIINYIILFIIVSVISLFVDYINIPSLLGLKIKNMNWEFSMGLLNIIVVISLFTVTFRFLDKKRIECEKNKMDISFFLLNEAYLQCIKDIDMLNKDVIENYVVPKINFDSTENQLIEKIQMNPFKNENIIMDLIRDGQISKVQIEGYFKVKDKYFQYIRMSIICYDYHELCIPLKEELISILSAEMEKVKILI